MADSIAKRFARDVADHGLTVLHDDGLYRHLRFQRETWRPPLVKPLKSGLYWFDLITVPGSLIFRGDGESFVFARLDDMFEFFRGPVGTINPQYWAEKLTSNPDSVMCYQRELLEQHINEDVTEAIQDEADSAPEGAELKLDGLAAAVRDEVLDELIGDESCDRKVVDDFSYWAEWKERYRTAPDFRFEDSFEWHVRDYDWWFLWALHAIVWGIAKYDGRDTTMPEVTEPPRPIRAEITLAAPRVVTVELPSEAA